MNLIVVAEPAARNDSDDPDAVRLHPLRRLENVQRQSHPELAAEHHVLRALGGGGPAAGRRVGGRGGGERGADLAQALHRGESSTTAATTHGHYGLHGTQGTLGTTRTSMRMPDSPGTASIRDSLLPTSNLRLFFD